MRSLFRRWNSYLAVTGRAPRLEYWRVQVAMALATAVTLCLVVAATRIGGWLGAIPSLLILPIVGAGVATTIRRLHDRGKAAWWVVVFGAGPYALAGLAGALYEIPSPLSLAAPLLGLAAFVLSIWAWVELGFLRGSRGDNRYGPPPQRVRPASVA